MDVTSILSLIEAIVFRLGGILSLIEAIVFRLGGRILGCGFFILWRDSCVTLSFVG